MDRFHRFLIKYIVQYFCKLQIAFHELPAILGFCILMTIYNQVASGLALASAHPMESMYTPISREYEDIDTYYADDFIWIHERGVDLFTLFLYLHMFRKLYINAVTPSHEASWKGGVLLYLLSQVIIFTGLTLSCSHLSEVTLTIGINSFNSFCMFIGKVSWLIAPVGDLNIDSLTRLAYAHYFLSFVLGYFGVYHGLDMHYNWKTEETFDGLTQELDWYDEALINELSQVFNMLAIAFLVCILLYHEPEALHYELFLWGDIGMMTDVRYFGVAPHWYFRPYMGWLVACPFHYLGLLGLIIFFTGFYFQPTIMRIGDYKEYSGIKLFILSILLRAEKLSKKVLNVLPFSAEQSLFYTITFGIFLLCVHYSFSYLPYGRFFISLGANTASMIAYGYLFFYLCCPNLRKPRIYSFTQLKIF